MTEIVYTYAVTYTFKDQEHFFLVESDVLDTETVDKCLHPAIRSKVHTVEFVGGVLAA